MTAPVFWAGTDLDSIVFSDEEPRERCDFRRGECPAEALYEGTFKTVTAAPCPHNQVPYCLAHRDQILRAHGLRGLFLCPLCPGAEKALLRMEPLR